MSKPKFNIGDTVFFIESHIHKTKTIPCPMCYGKLEVTIILGNGEKQLSRCGYCGHGIDAPTGKATTYAHETEIIGTRVKGISEGGETSWEYHTNSGSKKEYEIYATKEDAIPEHAIREKETKERAQKWFEDSFINAKKSQIWSAGYHKKEIKYYNERIEWHELHLGKIKERTK